MTTHKPATALPQFAVNWEDDRDRVSLFTLGNKPFDCVIGTSKDSVKGKVFEELAKRANAYPQLVEFVQHCAISGDQEARALLSELGES